MSGEPLGAGSEQVMNSRLHRCGWLALCLTGLVLAPVAAIGQPASLDENALWGKLRELEELDAKEREIEADIAQNEKDRIAHNKRYDTLDLTSKAAVTAYTGKAREGRAKGQRLEQDLLNVRNRKRELDEDIKDIEARIARAELEQGVERWPGPSNWTDEEKKTFHEVLRGLEDARLRRWIAANAVRGRYPDDGVSPLSAKGPILKFKDVFFTDRTSLAQRENLTTT